MTPERTTYPAITYTASVPDLHLRASRQKVLEHMQAHKPFCANRVV